MTVSADELDFYRTQSVFSDPCSTVPAGTARELAALVRNVLIHREEGALFGFTLPEDRRDEAETRYAADILGVLRARSPRPLTGARAPEERFAGTCRDFALLLCTLLRASGIPARVRCGFAAYFAPGAFEDHWVTEYWDGGRGWRLADPQLPGVYDTGFDPLDVPRDQFLVAGEAWRRIRREEADPGTFGVQVIGLSGAWFVRSDVVRDLAALCRVEVLPWDAWGLTDQPELVLSKEELTLLDTVAEAEVRGGPLTGLLELHERNAGLRTPAEITSHTTYGGVRKVSLRSSPRV
ncbi:transglutaminase-like domain-containing protein [Streptomyces beijiangensis]|uniref:Transglutaminase domain-containing protein n=1 Tax=Streptomyces beijiangensis TaxID=163361 RepID=A0A939F5Y3_9ACTN|nr:transglutaminase-like domain-containing protein [Streptomyces beijiangensis]MBO0512935.1 transglutaminase domain-containing protein [Streptomyces beijiangensis]